MTAVSGKRSREFGKSVKDPHEPQEDQSGQRVPRSRPPSRTHTHTHTRAHTHAHTCPRTPRAPYLRRRQLSLDAERQVPQCTVERRAASRAGAVAPAAEEDHCRGEGRGEGADGDGVGGEGVPPPEVAGKLAKVCRVVEDVPLGRRAPVVFTPRVHQDELGDDQDDALEEQGKLEPLSVPEEDPHRVTHHEHHAAAGGGCQGYAGG